MTHVHVCTCLAQTAVIHIQTSARIDKLLKTLRMSWRCCEKTTPSTTQRLSPNTSACATPSTSKMIATRVYDCIHEITTATRGLFNNFLHDTLIRFKLVRFINVLNLYNKYTIFVQLAVAVFLKICMHMYSYAKRVSWLLRFSVTTFCCTTPIKQLKKQRTWTLCRVTSL